MIDDRFPDAPEQQHRTLVALELIDPQRFKALGLWAADGLTASMNLPSSKLFHAGLENLGLITIVALLFELVLRTTLPRLAKSIATGAIFGAGALASMASPTEIIPTVYFDMRHAFIVLAGVMGGWIAVLIAALSAAAFRSFSVGGPSVHVGLAGIAVSFLVAVLLPRVAAFADAPYRRLNLYGAAASISLVSIFLLPWERAVQALSVAGMPFVIGNWLGVMCAGHIVSYQLLRDRAERALRTENLVDELTGVLNRRGFEEVASQQFARAKRTGRPLALLIADIDHFKRINDRFGHLVGDEVLSTVGRIMTTAARKSDPVSRYGGEEFALFLPDASAEAAVEVADRIVRAIRHHSFQSEVGNFTVTISVGVFVIEPGFSGTLRDAVQEADRALYRAKRNGRDRTELSSSERAMAEVAPATRLFADTTIR